MGIKTEVKSSIEIVIPYEKYMEGFVEYPELLLEFNVQDDFAEKEKKIGFTKITKKAAGEDESFNTVKSETIEMDFSKKRIIIYKKNKKKNFKIIIAIHITDKNVCYLETIEKNPDFEIETKNFSYRLILYFDDYNIWNKVFDNEKYLNDIIKRFCIFLEYREQKREKEYREQKSNISLETNFYRKNNMFFNFTKIFESDEWKKHIKYESNSCIIIYED